jgi:hypothetical protein
MRPDESDHQDPSLSKRERSLIDIFERVASGGVHVDQRDAVASEQSRFDEPRTHKPSGSREPRPAQRRR